MKVGIERSVDVSLADDHQPGPPSPRLRWAGNDRRWGSILGMALYMQSGAGEGTSRRQAQRCLGVWLCALRDADGTTPFAGETVPSGLAAILKTEPNWYALPAVTWPGVRRLLRRCLTKGLCERLRDIGDARLELLDAQDVEAGFVAVTKVRSVRLPWLVVGVLGVLAAVLSFLRRWLYVGVAVYWRVYQSTILPPAASKANFGGRLALSPDGRRLAFVTVDGDGRTVLRGCVQWMVQLGQPLA